MVRFLQTTASARRGAGLVGGAILMGVVLAGLIAADHAPHPAQAATPPPGGSYFCFFMRPDLLNPPPRSVELTIYDQFLPGGQRVRVNLNDAELCDPAVKAGSRFSLNSPLVACYTLQNVPDVANPPSVQLTTQFHSKEPQAHRIGKAYSLCVPADIEGGLGVGPPPSGPFFVCHEDLSPVLTFVQVQVATWELNLAGSSVEVRASSHVCVPANKNVQNPPPGDAGTGLVCYYAPRMNPTTARLFRLSTQFVNERVRVSTGSTLCVPTIKSPAPPTPTPGARPNYLCYGIRDLPSPTPTPVRIDLFDQFETGRFGQRATVGNPEKICAPATKTGVGGKETAPFVCYHRLDSNWVPRNREITTQYVSARITLSAPAYVCVPVGKGAEVAPSEPVYSCYELDPTIRVDPPVDVHVEVRQFNPGGADIRVFGLWEFCVPGGKSYAPSPNDLLGCFAFDGEVRPEDSRQLTLRTQFQISGWQTEVGLANRWCVPAGKSCPLEFPAPPWFPICASDPVAVGGLSVDLGSSSGGDAGVLAAVIAGGVAGAFALGGGAWYARRRLS